MTVLRCMIILAFATTAALGQGTQQSKLPGAAKGAGAVVRSLYSVVVARHPVGIPNAPDMKAFAPYLSKALLGQINLAHACEGDYYRHHPDPNLKPPIEWLEFGLFTGGMEDAAPRAFHLLGTEPQEDGSFRIYVELITMYGLPVHPKPSAWYVAAMVVRENGKFVVDDVIFLKDYSTLRSEFRLSQVLRAGCNGARWVGYRKR